MFYLLHCFALAELKCFWASPTLMCLIPHTLQCNGFLQMETQLDTHEVANELFAKGEASTLAEALTCY